MTNGELRALVTFAYNTGRDRPSRDWKMQLQKQWEVACYNLPEDAGMWNLHQTHQTPKSLIPYRAPLQRLRNDPDFGPSGLKKFRLEDAMTLLEVHDS